MPTHDFEKQVQQKMDELKFVPSEAVWEEVAKQIRERRDRRRLLLWWLLLPLLAGGSIGIYKAGKHSSSAATPALTVTAAPSPAEATPVHATGNTIAPANKSSETPATGTAAATTYQQYASGIAKRSHKTAIGLKNLADDKAAMTTNITAAIEANTVIAPFPGATEENRIKRAYIAPVLPRDWRISVNAASPGATSLSSLSAASIAKADSVQALIRPVQHARKMEWVININTGYTGISSGFSLPKSSPAAYDFSPANNSLSSSTPNGGSPGGGGTASPSAVRPGFAFTAGVAARLFPGRIFSLETGVQYSYYSTSVQVGPEIGSSSNAAQYTATGYSNTGPKTTYTNQYHFMEIPVRAQWQFGRRSPLTANTGLSIGRLIGSNALQYNGSSYYRDNSVINKTQLNLSAGFDVRFLREKPVSFEIGPRLQYELARLFEEQVYGPRHLLFAGLEMRMFFGKK